MSTLVGGSSVHRVKGEGGDDYFNTRPIKVMFCFVHNNMSRSMHISLCKAL